MKAMWKVEVIGYGGGRRGAAPPKRPWLAEITGLSARYGLHREFLQGQLDWENANRTGTRGVHMYWVLSPGRVYEASWSESWARRERAFLRVADGTVEQISGEEVETWLQNRLNVARVSTA